MTITNEPLIKINVPHWYVREDFLAWLNVQERATWHRLGEPPNEFSDVFITVDGDEGSDCDILMPEDIWATLTEIVKRETHGYSVVWLTNLAE